MKIITINLSEKEQITLTPNDGSARQILPCESGTGRGAKLRAAFEYAFGGLEADAVITLPLSGACDTEAVALLERALEEGASAALCDCGEPSPLICGWAFRLLMRFTAGLKGTPWTTLRAYKADCAELAASVKGDDIDYEIALMQAIVTEKLLIAQLTANTNPEPVKPKKSFKTTFMAGVGIISHSQSLKFLLSSGIAFIIDTLLLTLLAPILPWQSAVSVAVAQTVAWFVSSMTNFLINQKIVFRAKGGTLVAMGQYYSLAIGVYFGKQLLLFVFHSLLKLPLLLAKLICEVVFFVSNYFIQKKLIFRRKKRANP